MLACCEVEPSASPPTSVKPDSTKKRDDPSADGRGLGFGGSVQGPVISASLPDSRTQNLSLSDGALPSKDPRAGEIYFLGAVESGDWVKAPEVKKILERRRSDREVLRAAAKAAEHIACEAKGLAELVECGALHLLAEAWHMHRTDTALAVLVHNVAARFWEQAGSELPFSQPAVLGVAKAFAATGKVEWLEEVHRVAVRLHEQGNHGAALEGYLLVVEQFEARFGSSDQRTLQARNNLAVVLEEVGRLEDADKLHQENCERLEKCLGALHPDTLSAKFNRAALKAREGDGQQAEKLYQEVIQERGRILGARHADTLRAQGNLAALFRRSCRLSEAESVLKTLVAHHASLGPSDVETLRTKISLASVLMQQGDADKSKEAEVLLREVHTYHEQALGRGHPETLAVSIRLATLLEQKISNEAALLREQVFQCLDDVAPLESRRTKSRQAGYVANLQEFGEPGRAEAMLRQVAERRNAQLGRAHPDAIVSRSELAAFLLRRGDAAAEEALCLQREVVETSESTLGLDHVDTLASKASLAAFLTCKIARLLQNAAAATPGVNSRMLGGQGGSNTDDVQQTASLLATEVEKLLDGTCSRFPVVVQKGAFSRQAASNATDLPLRTPSPSKVAVLVRS